MLEEESAEEEGVESEEDENQESLKTADDSKKTR